MNVVSRWNYLPPPHQLPEEPRYYCKGSSENVLDSVRSPLTQTGELLSMPSPQRLLVSCAMKSNINS